MANAADANQTRPCSHASATDAHDTPWHKRLGHLVAKRWAMWLSSSLTIVFTWGIYFGITQWLDFTDLSITLKNVLNALAWLALYILAMELAFPRLSEKQQNRFEREKENAPPPDPNSWGNRDLLEVLPKKVRPLPTLVLGTIVIGFIAFMAGLMPFFALFACIEAFKNPSPGAIIFASLGAPLALAAFTIGLLFLRNQWRQFQQAKQTT